MNTLLVLVMSNGHQTSPPAVKPQEINTTIKLGKIYVAIYQT